MTPLHPILRLSVLGYVEPETTQPEQARTTHPLRDGNHLRWSFNARLRFPDSGFDVYRASGDFSTELVEAHPEQAVVAPLEGEWLRVAFHGQPLSYCELHGFKGIGPTHLFVLDRGRHVRHITYPEGPPKKIRVQQSVFDTVKLYGDGLSAGKVLLETSSVPPKKWQRLAHVHSLPELLEERDSWEMVKGRLPAVLSRPLVEKYQKVWNNLLELYKEGGDRVVDDFSLNLTSGQEQVNIHLMRQIALLGLDPHFATLVGMYFVDGPDYPGLELPAAELGETFRYQVAACWKGLGKDVAVSKPVGDRITEPLRVPEHPRTVLIPGVLQTEASDKQPNSKVKKTPSELLFRFRVALDWNHESYEMCEIRKALIPRAHDYSDSEAVSEDDLDWSSPEWYLQANNVRVEDLPARAVDFIIGPEQAVTHQVRVLDTWGRLSPWSISTRLLPLRSDAPLACPVNPRIKVIDQQVPRLSLSWEYPKEAARLAIGQLCFVIVALPKEIKPSIECQIRDAHLGAEGVSVNMVDLPSVSEMDLTGARLHQGGHSFPIRSFTPGAENALTLQADSPEAATPAILLPDTDVAEIMLDLNQTAYWQPVGIEEEYDADKVVEDAPHMTAYQVEFEQPNLRPTLNNPKSYPRFGVYAMDNSRKSIVAGPVIPMLFLSDPPPSPDVPHPIRFDELGEDAVGKRWIRLEWPESSGYRYQVLRGSSSWVGVLLNQIAESDVPSSLHSLRGPEFGDALKAEPDLIHNRLTILAGMPEIRRGFSLLNGAPVEKPVTRDFLPARATNTSFLYVVRLLDPVGNSGDAYAVGLFQAKV